MSEENIQGTPVIDMGFICMTANKCKELEAALTALRAKNAELESRVKELEEAIKKGINELDQAPENKQNDLFPQCEDCRYQAKGELYGLLSILETPPPAEPEKEKE